ncbi:MAG: transaldolase [Candidatus Roizmanbacteria bacterium]|nr:transaldolase [Candidatus Roizmanbacteria bacterium]
MKPQNLSTKIFLDSGDPDDTRKALDELGFLDGQTTNPSLVAKKVLASGVIPAKAGISEIPDQVGDDIVKNLKLTEKELLGEYKKIVREISSLIPRGSVSIEVYADEKTTAPQMLKQGTDMFSWIPNAHIKFPTTREGLKAAEEAVSEGMRVNMTLVFQQEQAAAVYAATRNTGVESLPGLKNVFVSPFIGRLDDIGINGMDLIQNITNMYTNGDGHVMNLSASIRSLDHFLGSVAHGADIITCPFAILEEWAHREKPVPDSSFTYDSKNLKPIPYQKLDLDKSWTEFDISHKLTDVGLTRFANDWKALIE